MRFTVCESNNPPIRELIQNHYIPWYCDVDTSTEWYDYASGLDYFTLPLIAIINPAEPNSYLNRTTGVQTETNFYQMLLDATVGPEPVINTTSLPAILYLLNKE